MPLAGRKLTGEGVKVCFSEQNNDISNTNKFPLVKL